MTKTKCGTLALVLVLSSFCSIRAYAFKIISKHGHEVRWNNVPVKYYIQDDGPKSFKSGYDVVGEKISLTEIIRRSFDSWKETEGTAVDSEYAGTITSKQGGDDGKNELIFIQSGWADLEFSPPSGALAVTISTYDTGSGTILDSDIYFNDDNFDWGNIDTDEEAKSGKVIDIQNIATHEIGHLFGLDHSSESPGESNKDFSLATMFFSSAAGETFRRELKLDDMSAIQHLYPTKELEDSIPEPSIDSISPNYGNNDGTDVKVTVTGSNFGELTMIKLTGNDIKQDEICKIVTRNENSIDCVFDLYYVTKGDYKIVVSNSYKKEATLKENFSVYGDSFKDNTSSGGCGRIDENGNPGNIVMFGLIILIFPIMIGWSRRRALATIRFHNRRK